MLSRKIGLVSAFGATVFVLGLLLESDSLLLSAVPIWLYVAFALTPAPPHTRVSVARTPPSERLYEKDEGVVTLKVSNRGPRVHLEVFDAVPPGLAVTKGSNHVFATLAEGESREFRYAVSPQTYGTFVLGPIRVRATDWSASRHEESSTRSLDPVRAYPGVSYLGRVQLRHPHPRNWPGETVARRAGQGLEYYGVKERGPGEPFRRVNWKATARTGRVMVNEYMDEAGGETLVIFDARGVSRVGVPPESSEDYAVHAVSALSYRLLRDRNRVALLKVGGRLVRVPLGSGKRHFERIMVGLVSEIGERGVGWDLAVVPRYVSAFFSRMVHLVVVTPVVDDAPLAMVAELSRRGYDVLVLSPSAIPLDLPPGRETRAWALGRELAAVDRRTKLASMSACARVVDWNPRGSLADALEWAQPRGRRR